MTYELCSRAKRILHNEGPLELIRQSKNHITHRFRYPLFNCAKIVGAHNQYYAYVEAVHSKCKQYNVDKYSTPINPYKIISISPDDIVKVTRRTLPAVTPKPDLFGRVKDGNWDQRTKLTVRKEYEEKNPNYRQAAEVRHGCTTFENTVLYQSFKSHFDEGVEWKNTELYQWYDSGVYKPTKYKSGLDEFFEKYDRIYERIATDGYKTQRELRTQPFPWDRYEEIIVDIGRNGEFLFVNGRHRLSIAKILGLSKIPVVVSVRHKQWMKYCDEVWKKEMEVPHPDLKNKAGGSNSDSGTR